MNLGTGWLEHGALPWNPLRASASDAHIAAALEREASLPRAYALDVEPWVTNQKDQERCFFETMRRWIHALTGKKTSCWVPWLDARLIDDTAAQRDPLLLKNVGVTAYAAVQAMREGGACSLDICPEYFPSVNTEEDPKAAIPPQLMRDAAQAYNVDLVQLYAIGDAVVTGTRDAIFQGRPFGTTIRANQAYLEAIGGFGGHDDGTGNWHSVYIDTFREGQFSPDWEFGTWSSWGTAHGPLGGRVWLPASRLRVAPFNGFAVAVN